MRPERYIGLISGTSRDGVDAALVDFEDGRPDLLHADCTPYPDGLRKRLDALLATGERPAAADCADLARQLGRFFARVSRELMQGCGLEARDVRAIGSHGQTAWHEPGGEDPVSLQLGDPALIARLTGITTVGDFRNPDIRAGGQGAPLAPLLHRELFHRPGHRNAVLNLGGIANLTLLHADGVVRGFDTGPANCLMDLWVREHLGEAFDENGGWASEGKVDDDLLERLLDEPYFTAPAPKSTGLETFNRAWLDARLGEAGDRPADVQRTLAELTARTVASGLTGFAAEIVLVCGGGVHNRFLMERLGDSLGETGLESTAAHGMHPDWVEACLFAWLARERIHGRPQDTGPITGAREAVLLGEVHQP